MPSDEDSSSEESKLKESKPSKSLSPIQEGELIILLGRSRSGKTTLIESLELPEGRLFTIDFLGVQSEGVVRGNAELQQTAPLWGSGEEIVFIPELKQKADDEKDYLDRVFKFLYEFQGPNPAEGLTVKVDELDYACTAHYTPHGLRLISRFGRHRKITVIAGARRAAELPKSVFTQATRIIAFNFKDEKDRKVLESFGAEDLDQLEKWEYQVFGNVATETFPPLPLDNNEIIN